MFPISWTEISQNLVLMSLPWTILKYALNQTWDYTMYHLIFSHKSYCTVKPSNSGHPKQRTCLWIADKMFSPKCLLNYLPIVNLLITGKFLKNRRCPLFRGFTVLLSAKLHISDFETKQNIMFVRVLNNKEMELIPGVPLKLHPTSQISRNLFSSIVFDY